MHKDDEALCAILKNEQKRVDGTAPDFDAVMVVAAQKIHASRRLRFGGFVAAVAVAALAFALMPGPEETYIYVDLKELEATTSWSAPSDSLLPQHQIDIYRDLPRLFESTETDGGTLL